MANNHQPAVHCTLYSAESLSHTVPYSYRLQVRYSVDYYSRKRKNLETLLLMATHRRLKIGYTQYSYVLENNN